MAPAITQSNGSKNNDIVGWVSDPDGRGTSGLVISCLLTLGLCVWSALHLNIPAKNESRREYWLRRIKWSTCGVLIPEIVVLLAWRQWTSAGRLTKEVNKIFRETEWEKGSSKSTPSPDSTMLDKLDRGSSHRKHPWTNVHSFYAGAGGFVFDLDPSEGGYGLQPFIAGPQRLTLTAHGVLLLAKSELLPDLDEREILDKSKTDGLAKVLVLLQAGWMLLQTIDRVATHIPISLLEVNTIGHIMCAFVVYLLWWSKPREIHEPTVLKGDWVDSMCAYMYMSSRISGTRIRGYMKPRSWVIPELKRCQYLESDKTIAPSQPLSISRENTIEGIDVCSDSDSQKQPVTSTEIEDSKSSGIFELQPFRCLDSQQTINRKLKMGWTPHPSSDTSSMRQTRYKLAAAAVQRFPAVKARLIRSDTKVKDEEAAATFGLKPFVEQLVARSARNWPSDFLLPGLKGETMGMTLWFATMVYGGVHIAAWNEYFPTDVERELWHLSSVYITCSGLLWLFMNVMGALIPWAESYWERFIAFRAFWIEYIFYGTIATACGVLYLFARAFLVIDAVVTLRQIPAQTYATPEWSEIIPHL